MRRYLWLLLATLLVPQTTIGQPIFGNLVVEAVGEPDPHAVWVGAGETLVGKVWYDWGNVPISGTEFRLTGIPAGWIVIATPNPAANVVIGSVVDGTGITILFPTCMGTPDPSGRIRFPILDLTIFATTFVPNVRIYPAERNPPRNPTFDCRLGFLCANEGFAPICVGGAGLCINSGSCHPGPVGVEQQTWSEVKSLYR